MSFQQSLPLYNCNGSYLGEILLSEAQMLVKAGDATYTSQGRGRNYRITSIRLQPRRMWHWAVRYSGGYAVTQLVPA